MKSIFCRTHKSKYQKILETNQTTELTEEKEAFDSPVNNESTDNEQYQKEESSTEFVAEENGDLSSLKEDMDRTIQEISQQLVEDESFISNISFEPSSPINKEDSETSEESQKNTLSNKQQQFKIPNL